MADSIRVDVIDVSLNVHPNGGRAERRESLATYLSRLEWRLEQRDQQIEALELALASLAEQCGITNPLIGSR